jgi:hypothetical protein
VHGVERGDGIGQGSGVKAHQPHAEIRGCRPAEQKHFGLLKTSVENGCSSIEMGL